MTSQQSTTSALIPFAARPVGTETIETVDARDLHAFLEVKTDYAAWIKRRIETYGFLQDIDFCVVIFGDGPTKTINHFVSLDMAKELSMVERTKKGKEARQYFLACEKALHEKPALPMFHAQVDDLRICADFLASMGALEDRDKLMLADLARTSIQQRYALPAGATATLPAPVGFFLAERVAALGYRLTRKEESSLLASGLARHVAAEYRTRYNDNPRQSQKFVDGAVRPVNWYRQVDAAWIDPMIQAACAHRGFVMTT